MAVPASTAPSATTKADLGKRFIAALIDFLLAGVVSVVPFVGPIVGGAYVLVRDGLDLDFARRRSIGKQVMKLRLVRLDGQTMNLETSLRRNLPLCIGYVALSFTSIWLEIKNAPLLGGATALIVGLVLGLVGVVVAIIEVIKVLTDAEGRRFGDVFAGTKVIEVAD
jgi:uncharacterized RDD family membrane protein YckC